MLMEMISRSIHGFYLMERYGVSMFFSIFFFASWFSFSFFSMGLHTRGLAIFTQSSFHFLPFLSVFVFFCSSLRGVFPSSEYRRKFPRLRGFGRIRSSEQEENG